MYIFCSDGRKIVNADFVERFVCIDKEDAVLIGSVSNQGITTLGRYNNEEEAKENMAALFTALAGEQVYYQMPARCKYEDKVQDARTKRHGGS
mgnify:CR=1 FL=1